MTETQEQTTDQNRSNDLAERADSLNKHIDELEHMLLVLLVHIVVRDAPRDKRAIAKSFLKRLDLDFATGEDGRRLRFKMFEDVQKLTAEP